MEDTDPIDDILECYHYGVFVPMERLRFSLGYVFYPVVRFLVDWLIVLLGKGQ
jgi:hypothetical protein